MPKSTVNMLCIRDPDYENSYVFDAPVNEITIDMGGMWNGYKDFCSDLADGDDTALEYEQSMLEEVAHLPEDNPVRYAVVQYFAEAHKMYGEETP